MNNPTLYEISLRYLGALDMATDPDCQVDMTDTLDAVEGEFREKALAVAGYFQNLEANIKAMREAEKRIADRRRSAESHVERLKAYLQDRMEAAGIERIECPEFQLALVKAPPSVEILDESQIPNEYIRVTITEAPDKAAIKEAGGCPGARIVTDKRVLRIR